MAPPRPRLVLLVDDNTIQRRMIEQHLRAEGLDVASVPDAATAMAALRATPPDLVFSDVVMGEIDGFRLCQMVREHPPTATVPVILASAHCDAGRDATLAAAVGATAIIERTPDLSAELAAVRKALAGGTALPARSDAAEVDHMVAGWASSQVWRLSSHALSAERWYRTVFEKTHDAIAVLDESGRVLEVNPRCEELLGLPADQIIGQHMDAFAAVGHQAGNWQHFAQALQEAVPSARTMSFRRANGLEVRVEVSTTRVEVEGQVRIFAVGRDVSAQFEAQRRLATSERRLRSLLESIPDAIWASTLEGALTNMSANIVRIYGRTAEEVMATPIEERVKWIHPEDQPLTTSAYLDALEGSKPTFDLEYRVLHANGDWVWVHNRGRVVIGSDEVRRFEGAISDVSARKRLEQHAAQLQKMEAVGQLTAGVAHDFNNVLASILTNTQNLSENMSAHDVRRTDVEEIRQAAERAAALTRQLLAFSRKQIVSPTTMDLHAVAAGMDKMVRRLIGEDIDLTLAPSREARPIRADIGQIEQVILNLCVNARDAMPEGGKIAIEVADVVITAEEERREEVPAGSYVVLSVADTGCGMDEATRKRCFEPFFTTKGVGQGTGLGLSTTYGIVHQNEGHIRLNSEVGKGTTFKLYFPPSAETPPRAQTLTPPAAPVARGHETILLVEDDKLVRSAVNRLLVARGYKVLPVNGLEEALAISVAHAAPIDLVVTDLIMPGASGPKVIAELRAVLPPFRVLYMSGHAEHPMFAEGGIQPGVNFVQKPFTNDELALKIREILTAAS